MFASNSKKKSSLATNFLLLNINIAACCNVYSAAFQLHEQNSSGLGNAYAGRTAIAEDASTSFYNPAGLVFINNPQFLGSLVNPFASFDAKSKVVTRSSTGTAITQGKFKDDAGGYVPLPAMHFANKFNENWFYGFSVTVPYGLKTEYAKDTRFRYFATKSELKTIDMNPNVAYKFNNNWSVGAGVSAQYAKAKVNRQIDAALIAAGAENINFDGQAHNTADGWGFGYNLGVLFQPNTTTRIGFAYRSKIKHDVEGDIKISIPPGVLSAGTINALGLIDQKATASVTLPEVISISSFKSLNSEWDVMGDITYTAWHRFKKLVIKYPDPTALADNRVEEKFKDSFKIALGANYKYSKNLKVKFGTAFDDSPVADKHRNIRIPDSNRYWLSTGLQYLLDKNFTLDAGYSYIFVKSASVNEILLASPTARITADYNSSIHLFGVQAVYNFV